DEQHGRNGEGAICDQLHLENWIGRAPLVHDQHYEGAERDCREVTDPRALEPVGTIAAIHHDLAEPQREHQAYDSQVVSAALALELAQVRRMGAEGVNLQTAAQPNG